MRTRRLSALLGLAGLVLTAGCVSQHRYNQIAQSNDERLRRIQELEDQNAALQAEKDALDAKLAAMKAKPAASGPALSALPAGVTKTERGLRVEERVLFSTASADLTAEGKSVLARVAKILSEADAPVITVEGHADDRPIVRPESRKHWPGGNQQLSEARAQAVADFLAAQGVAKEKLRTAGYGSSRPLAVGKTEAARRQNRRVEITLK